MVTDREGKETKEPLNPAAPTGMEIGSRQENETGVSGRSPGMGLGDGAGLGVLFVATG
jgi:hypothetical protein